MSDFSMNSREGTICLDRDMAELVLLLPAQHLHALEAAARARGRTAAQMVRSLIRGFLVKEGADVP
jgi:hypothetical protein